jgi:hypothetical protein
VNEKGEGTKERAIELENGEVEVELLRLRQQTVGMVVEGTNLDVVV